MSLRADQIQNFATRLPGTPDKCLKMVFVPVYFFLLLATSISSAQSIPALLIQPLPKVDESSRPLAATQASAIRVDATLLLHAVVGTSLQIQMSGESIPELTLVDYDSYINGDLVYRARAETEEGLYSLVLTLGETSLFGHLSSPTASYQIVGELVEAGYEGWIYLPGVLTLPASGIQSDYVIPDKQLPPVRTEFESRIPLVLPLTLGNENTGPRIPQSTVGEASVPSSFGILQKFNRRAVQIGQTIDLQLSIENLTKDLQTNSTLDIYFLLEDSKLIHAPQNCRAKISPSLQRVLSCELGSFAPGEKKSGSITVMAEPDSKPIIFSTVIMGDLRSDAYINVVDDVLTDTDGDGIGDYNEHIQGTDPEDEYSVTNDAVTIDIMAFYTAGAASLYPGGVETRINQLISVANQIYADSGVGITLRPVYHGLVAYNDQDDMDTALSHIIDKTDPAFADVDTLRANYGGDLVMLFRPLGADNSKCGLATVGGFKTEGYFDPLVERGYAYSHIGIDCPKDIVVAHELGHNMGLTHSHREDGQGGTFNFSTGYGVESEFVTVMAFPAAFNTTNQMARFSNPAADCSGHPCGRDANDDFGADAVLSLNTVKFQIADYFPSQIPELPKRQVLTLSGSETDASIAIAASLNDGLSFAQTIPTDAPLDVAIAIELDSQHIGSQGSIHILLSAVEGEYWQVEKLGGLTRWDGSSETLRSYDELRILRSHEQIKLIDDYRLDTSLAGLDLSIFVAYQIPQLNELIYTPEPLVLQIRSGP